MKKVIVYGMGVFFSKVKEQINNEAEIIAYANSTVDIATSHSGKLYDGKKVLAPSEIMNVEFDCVYICTEPYNANPIYELLLKNGIPSKKIEMIWKRDAVKGYWKDYPLETGDGFISDINGVKILQKYHTDFDFVPEVFYYNTYYLDMGTEDTVVIDIGMNIGIASLWFASKKEVVKVYGFEPFRDTYSQAIDNINLNSDEIKSKIITFNFGLTDKNEIKKIAVSAEESGYRNVFIPASSDNSVEIECKDAGEVVGKIIADNIDKKILLKVDTEGSEYVIFNSLQKEDCFKKIDAILMEYHNGADNLIEILKNYGYKIMLHGPKEKLGMLYAIK